jgi:hypothetical protein
VYKVPSPKLIVRGNSVAVQTLVPNNRSSEPWNGLLLGLMEHNGSREHLGIIIGRIIVRRIQELCKKNMAISSSDIGKCNGRKNVPHKFWPREWPNTLCAAHRQPEI